MDDDMDDIHGAEDSNGQLPQILTSVDDSDDGSVWIGLRDVGKKKSYLTAWVAVDAPRELIWSLITQCDYAYSFLPHVKECEIQDSGVEDGKSFEVVYHRLKPYTLLPSVDNISKSVYTPYETIDFSRYGGDFIEYEGQWQLIPQVGSSDNGKVWIHYHVEGELTDLMSQNQEQKTMRKDTTSMLKQLRKLAESYAPDYRAALLGS